MKNKFLFLFAIGLIVLSLSSCVTTNKGYQSSPVISRNVELDPIKADIVVDEAKKLKGESTATYFGPFRLEGDNTIADGIVYSTDASASIASQLNPINALKVGRLTKVRGAAAYKALEGGDYDVLVHPVYSITTKNYFFIQIYTVEVKGYGANYQNFRAEPYKTIILDGGQEYTFPDGK